MNLSTCDKCWNDDCTCGYKYKNISSQTKTDMVLGLTKYMSDEERLKVIASINTQEKTYVKPDITKDNVNKKFIVFSSNIETAIKMISKINETFGREYPDIIKAEWGWFDIVIPDDINDPFSYIWSQLQTKYKYFNQILEHVSFETTIILIEQTDGKQIVLRNKYGPCPAELI